MARRKRRNLRSLPQVHPFSAGIDIGAQIHVVAIPPDLDAEPVRTFQTFTGELYALVSWLKESGIKTVAMESTGIYWIPLYEMLQSQGIEVYLVNARDVKQVPGRKTDVNDAQWLQQLHQYGLLRSSFLPTEEIARLRAYLRQREKLLEYAAAHIQHMQRALTLMNLQLQHVVSDITGATGMRIIRGILDGIQDPKILASYRDVRCKASEETIGKALEGHYRPEHLFLLRQSVDLYDSFQEKVKECDQQLSVVLETLKLDEPPEEPLPKPRHRTRQPNALKFDVRQALYAMIGVDLTQIHGIGPYLALKLISECGTDMNKWSTAKHFTSWLCLSPGNRISGGKVLSSSTRRSSSRAAALLRLSAVNVGKTDTAMGAFYRRLASRIGKSKAVTATARKIAIMFYNVLRFGMTYQDPGADEYEQRYRERVLTNLTRRAKKMGFELTAIPEPAEGVS